MWKNVLSSCGTKSKTKVYASNLTRRKFSDGTKKESALLSVLKSDRSPKSKSQNVRRGNNNSSISQDNNTKSKFQKKAKPKLSFFDEVDNFLKEHKKKEETSSGFSEFTSSSNLFGQSENASKNSDDSNSPNSATEPARKWTWTRKDEILSDKSIFDLFKVPEAAPERSPNAFDLEAYEAFCSLLEPYLEAENNKPSKSASNFTDERKEDVIRWIRAEEHLVPVGLPTLSQLFKDRVDAKENQLIKSQTKAAANTEIRKQSRDFRKHLSWTNAQYNYAIRILRDMSKLSAANHKALPIVVIWEKLKEAGYLKDTMISVCLQASTSFSAMSLSRNRGSLGSLPYSMSGMNDPADDDCEGQALVASVPEQLAIINDLLYEPTKQTISIRMRRLVSIRDAQAALDLIESRMEKEDKARSYIPVFRLFIELGEIDSAFRLFEKMKANHDMVPVEPELFVQLIAGTAERGFFCHESKPLSSAQDIGYSPASGPRLFDQLASEMAEYVVSMSSASAKRLQRAFTKGFCGTSEITKDQFDTGSLVPLMPRNDLAGENEMILDRVSVDPLRGDCPRSGVKLKLIELATEQKDTLKKSLLKLVRRTAHAKNVMLPFWDWLDKRRGEPFTVIVDGANVAFYMQNFDRGSFNFHQIHFVVAALRSIGENPLVILPHKYQLSYFQVTLGTASVKQSLRSKDRAILEELHKDGRLYVVPPGCHDDYFWILASVSNQTESRGKQSLRVSHDEEGQRWPGGRPVVLTNDQIRDHQLHLLEPNVFNRWYSNTIVNYNFTGFVDDECIDPEIGFSPADFFSREIQMNESGQSHVWHFPVQDWETTDWFCIRLPCKEHR